MSVIKETKQEIREVEVIVGIKCDICGKNIKGKYWWLMTSHNDWGHDSVDSIKHYDLCSEKCVSNMFKEYFDDCKHSKTQRFELEQAYCIPKGGD